jgi:hypothetical protein
MGHVDAAMGPRGTREHAMETKSWKVKVTLKDGRVIEWEGPAGGPSQALLLAIFDDASPEEVKKFEGEEVE